MIRLPLAATMALLFSAQTAFAALPTFTFWPDGEAPGAKNSPVSFSLVERSKDPMLPDRAVTGIRAPEITVYAPERPNGVALLVRGVRRDQRAGAYDFSFPLRPDL